MDSQCPALDAMDSRQETDNDYVAMCQLDMLEYNFLTSPQRRLHKKVENLLIEQQKFYNQIPTSNICSII